MGAARVGWWAVVSVLLVMALAGCTPKEQPSHRPAEGREMPDWAEYEGKLQRGLFDLATAEDPEALARKKGLELYPMVRVVLELQDPEAELPEDVPILVEDRVDGTVQALVPIDRLLSLAKRPEIQYIRLPVRPRRL
jgi:hypothetical protein